MFTTYTCTGINSTLENMDMDTMLLHLAKSVVSTVWVELPAEDVDAVIDAEPDEDEDYYEYCFCKEGLDFSMNFLDHLNDEYLTMK